MSRWPPPTLSALLCPVCGGTGKARSEFYPDLARPVGMTNPVFVDCRTCVGKGIVFVTDGLAEVRQATTLETPYLAVPPVPSTTLETPYLAVPPVPSNPAWRESLRAMIENARPAVEAMKDGRTQDYMLNPEAMIAFFDGLEEALRATAADKDWQSLPEYSTSLPTWQTSEKGDLIGVRKWKRHNFRLGEDYWMIGEAFMFPLSKRVNILWSRVP